MSTLVGQAAAQPVPSPVKVVDVVEVRGARRTRTTTITGLLPRQPPASYLARELDEFERRLNNLGVFDRVEVHLEERRLVVSVREKWTLIPSVDFATGQTLADTFVSVGATEYNFLGTAAMLAVFGSYQDRGLNGSITWAGHAYDPHSAAPFAEAFYASAGLSFDSGEEWRRDQTGGALGFTLPYTYRVPLRVNASFFGYSERISEATGRSIPSSGTGMGTSLELSWDRFVWHDLASSGYELVLRASAGAFVPAMEARHEAAVTTLFALAPTETAVFMGRFGIEAVSGGNPNHSLLLSGWEDVRGLSDSQYRDQVHVTGNVELRQAVRFAERWALQGAAFLDAALFVPMDVTGSAQRADVALGAGCGVRLIPTLIAQVVPRLDVGRLFAPEQRWFVQLALAQYF